MPNPAQFVSYSVVTLPVATPAPAERFVRILDGLCSAVAARGGGRDRLAGPLVILIWRHLRRIAAQVAALAARIAAGRQRRYPARRPPRAAPRRAPHRALPHGPAWLVALVPQAAGYGSQLQHLLAEPEFAALVDAAPQMRRLLRPLCRMLGVRPPAALALPPRPAKPGTSTRPSAGFPHPPAPPPLRRAEPTPLCPPRACGPPVVAA